MTTTANPAAGEAVPDACGCAAPMGEIHPRGPRWRQVKDIDDAVVECGMLASLLSATEDILREMDYGQPDGGRNIALDNVSALVTVSQGMAQYLASAIDKLPRRAA